MSNNWLVAIASMLIASAIVHWRIAGSPTPNKSSCAELTSQGVDARLVDGICYVKSNHGIERSHEYERRARLERAFRSEDRP